MLLRARMGLERKVAKLQKLCRQSEAWDEALRVAPRTGEREAAQAKLLALLAQIEANSYTDYIGAEMTAQTDAQGAPAEGLHATIAGRTEPRAIPSERRGRVLEDFMPDEGPAGVLCSPDDLRAARTMWVPATTPPTVEVSWACPKLLWFCLLRHASSYLRTKILLLVIVFWCYRTLGMSGQWTC